MNIFRKLYQKKMPLPIRSFVREIIEKSSLTEFAPPEGDVYKNDILSYYENSIDSEILESIDWIKRNNRISIFNFDFVKQYDEMPVEVKYDKIKSMYYILHNGLKVYYPKNMINRNVIRRCYRDLCMEQDALSPHNYIEDGVVYPCGTVLDCGAAEAMFTLSHLKEMDALYLFECNSDWVEALNATIEPYRDKVHIVQKYVSDVTNDTCITLDDFCSQNNITPSFVKMDIEGAEVLALSGAKSLISNPSIMWSLCTYHRRDDEKLISQIFKDRKQSFGHGYVASWPLQDLDPPYFRRAVIRIG